MAVECVKGLKMYMVAFGYVKISALSIWQDMLFDYQLFENLISYVICFGCQINFFNLCIT